MTIQDVAAELAHTHHSTVVICMESLRGRNMLYLQSNLRAALELHGARLASVKDIGYGLTIEKPNRSTVRVNLVTHDRCAEDPRVLKGYFHGTPMFTNSRAGWFRSEL